MYLQVAVSVCFSAKKPVGRPRKGAAEPKTPTKKEKPAPVKRGKKTEGSTSSSAEPAPKRSKQSKKKPSAKVEPKPSQPAVEPSIIVISDDDVEKAVGLEALENRLFSRAGASTSEPPGDSLSDSQEEEEDDDADEGEWATGEEEEEIF